MPLSAGTRLGPYEIVAQIGAGGMGEVYRAKDTRLGRDVAIKVLPPQYAESAERRERFEREAKVVSSLSHAHICALYDVGHQDGVDFLVMEYLEGESLAERLKRGALPLEQVLRHAVEVADALDKAHRQGIVHRDLKPGNIMLTKAGAKLLDFGLAKLKGDGAGGVAGALSTLPTQEKQLTQEGTLLGTLQYMAPEQLEGREPDRRTDIFALGAVLYEMATGKKAFEAKSQASLITAIMSAEPQPISALQPMTPPAFDRVVRTCLAKDPDERWQSAHDLVSELRWISEAGSEAGLAGPVAARRRKRERLAWGVALLASLAAAAAGARLFTRAASGPPAVVMRANLTLPPHAPLFPFFPALALSPDGTRLVYSSQGDPRTAGQFALWLRPLEGTEPTRIAGTEGGAMPFFSPDGQWIGFLAAGKLKKVAVTGGGSVAICDAAGPWGATWGPDDTIVFSDNRVLYRVSANGGTPEPLTKPEKDNVHRWPSFLPGGRAVVFAIGGGSTWNEARIAVKSLDTGERRIVAEGGTAPRYVPTGHIVFARGSTLFALPFDPSRLAPLGPPVPVLEGVNVGLVDGRANFALASSGSLVYAEGEQNPRGTLAWVGRNGTAQTLPAPPRGFEQPRISPDGRRVALTIREEQADVWALDLTRGTLTRLTFDPGEDESPIWTPDGKRVTFSASRSGRKRLTLQKAGDGSGVEETLGETERHQHLGSWSPDGRTLVAEETEATDGFGIYAIRAGEKPEVRPFLQTKFVEVGAALSPDGSWLAYSSNESGRSEVYVQAFPGPGGKWQISTDGGSEPRWAGNGRELFYRSGDRMMAVAVETRPAFSVGTPRLLFEGQYARVPWGQAGYDVSADGQRFLMIKTERPVGVTQLSLVANWFEELKRLAPKK